MKFLEVAYMHPKLAMGSLGISQLTYVVFFLPNFDNYVILVHM